MMVAQPFSFKLITRSLAIALLLAMFAFIGRGLAAEDLSGKLKKFYTLIDQTTTVVESGDLNKALTSFKSVEDEWSNVEDSIRPVSRESYKNIENAMIDVRVGLKSNNAAAALKALATMRSNLDAAVQAASSGIQTSNDSSVTLTSFIGEISDAQAAIAKQDAATALTLLDKIGNDWYSVEGEVKGRSVDTYSQFESNLPLARAALQQTPPDYVSAAKLLGELNTNLNAVASQAKSPYTFFDAGIVILREGFEALLIVTALVAFVVKSGNADKRGWIWGGGAAGIVVSVILAIILQSLIGTVASGKNGALIEGIIGLIAAVMLFYVSYWLHSKSSIASWNNYIKSRTTAAIASGSLLSLALLSFLSVFREGAETAMFYLGMAGSISISDLLLGMAWGFVALLVLAFVMLKLGMRIPIHTFFLISSILIYYLGFKFIGTGILALQGANILPTTAISGLPKIDFFGFYPTVEGVIAQGLVLVAGFIVWLYSRRHQAALTKQATMQPQA